MNVTPQTLQDFSRELLNRHQELEQLAKTTEKCWGFQIRTYRRLIEVATEIEELRLKMKLEKHDEEKATEAQNSAI